MGDIAGGIALMPSFFYGFIQDVVLFLSQYTIFGGCAFITFMLTLM